MRLVLAGVEIPITPQRVLSGRLFNWRRALTDGKGVPYAYVEVGVVHHWDCAATREGERSGPCDCGGDEMLKHMARLDGEPMVSESVRTVAVEVHPSPALPVEIDGGGGR